LRRKPLHASIEMTTSCPLTSSPFRASMHAGCRRKGDADPRAPQELGGSTRRCRERPPPTRKPGTDVRFHIPITSPDEVRTSGLPLFPARRSRHLVMGMRPPAHAPERKENVSDLTHARKIRAHSISERKPAKKLSPGSRPAVCRAEPSGARRRPPEERRVETESRAVARAPMFRSPPEEGSRVSRRSSPRRRARR
jgi:hypothetical protein